MPNLLYFFSPFCALRLFPFNLESKNFSILQGLSDVVAALSPAGGSEKKNLIFFKNFFQHITFFFKNETLSRLKATEYTQLESTITS